MADTSHNIKIREHPEEKDGYIIPTHYTLNKIQLIDVMESQLSKEGFIGFCKGLILKYLLRKNDDNDLRTSTKAKYYLDELINFLSETDKPDETHLKPSYYKNDKLGLETIDIIEDQLPKEELKGFYSGMVIRYVCRSSYKDHMLDDLIKAKYYLDRLIDYLKLS